MCTVDLQLSLALTHHAVAQDAPEALDPPLLHRHDGSAWSKAEVIAAWRQAEADGPRKEWEREEITGHSGRRTGVQLYARAGWERWQIQFLSRHGSSAVDGYIEEAYEAQTIRWTGKGLGRGRGMEAVTQELEDMRQEIKELKEAASIAPPPTLEIQQAIRDEKDAKGETLIKSEYSELIHVVPSGAQVGPAATWRTACRWKYALLGKYELAPHDAVGERCARCLGKW